MRNRFLYMKLLGLLLVILGFSYSITSFYNFFEYIFGYKIYPENLNIYMMSVGLIIPLFIFRYGVYFYFYTDFNITKISKPIFITNITLFAISVVFMLFKNIPYLNIAQIFELVHKSFGYLLLILSSMGIYGCFKYKF